MADFGQSRFDRLIADQYEAVKDEVLATVRAKLAAANLHPDPLDLDAAYNAAWHALYQLSANGGATVENLGGWLAMTAYRRAIDDIRRARPRLHANALAGHADALRDGCCERDVDEEISARQKYHQWLMSVRLRLTAREQQAISLCVLHEHSRREASEIMGIPIRRLDKIMTAANRKLGGALEAISRGDWCKDQRSLIKAHAFGLHDESGERHALAVQHLMQCQACAAYVRSVRGLSGVIPPSALLTGAVSAGGGILSALAAVFKGGTSGSAAAGGAGGAAAGGGGATLLGGLGAKSAVVCATAVCATGTLVVIETVPAPTPERKTASPPTRPTKSATASIPSTPQPTIRRPAKTSTSASTSGNARRSSAVLPDPRSQAAQEIAELGIEPQATQPAAATPTRPVAATPPPHTAPSEFDFEGG